MDDGWRVRWLLTHFVIECEKRGLDKDRMKICRPSFSSFWRLHSSADHLRCIFQSISLLEWSLIGLFVAHILSTSYLGVQGSHSWRQSDVYSQILGFESFKGLTPFSNFFSRRAIYDIPIYQAIIIAVSRCFGVASLVGIKIVNAVSFVFASAGFYSIIRRFSPSSTTVLAALIAVSPLFIHYYTTPFPDLLSISLAIFCVSGFIAGQSLDFAFVFIWILAVLIKSPVPFVFLLFALGVYFCLFLMKSRVFMLAKWSLAFYSISGVFAAYIAEKIRSSAMGVASNGGFAQNPLYYFGDAQQRLTLSLYKQIISRHLFNDLNAANVGWFYYLTILGTVIFIVALVYSTMVNRSLLIYYVPCAVAIIMPWIVFSNLYYKHNYYQIPGQFLLLGAIAIAFSVVIDALLRSSSYLIASRTLIPSWTVVFAVALLIPRMSFHSDLAYTNQWKAAKSVLRESQDRVYLYGAPREDDPRIGGFIENPIESAKIEDLYEVCKNRSASSLPNNGIILKPVAIMGDCLAWIKNVSKTFVDEDNYWMWMK